MNKLYKLFLLLLVAGLITVSCDGIEDSLVDDQLEESPLPSGDPEYSSGSADFSNFIAIGNSLTAGYADGALYSAGQNSSIPALLSAQLGVTVDGGINFAQPSIASEDGYNTSLNGAFTPGNCALNPLGRFKLDTNIPGPSPTIDGTCPDYYLGSVQNFGVPGIVVGQLLTPATGGPADPGNPAYNPFYARFAANPGTSTIIGEAVAAQPTFFSLWIGNNDVLGYAAGGASNPGILTSPGNFQAQFDGVINTMMTNTSAKGVVANIPSILGLAYFRAVTWNAIPLDAATAGQLNAGLAPVNGAYDALVSNMIHDSTDIAQRKISYAAGANPILVIDEELEDLGPKFDLLGLPPASRAGLVPYEQSRPLKAGELVVLGAGAVLNTGFNGNAAQPIGIVIPLGFNTDGSLSGDRFYLTLAEQQEIEISRAQFNGTIAAAVAANSTRLVLYDTNSPTGAFYDLFGISDGVPGITVDGVDLTPDFAPSGVLSTDGVHPNPRGNALIANGMLEAIEDAFGATLPRVSVLNQASVTLCAEAVGDCASQQPGS